MNIQENIVNRVALSGLVSLDLADIRPEGERILYDLKDNLFHGLILREKDFREFVKGHDWAQYKDKHVAVTCTADAIVPTWAYMLLASRLEPFVRSMVFGDLNALEDYLFNKAIDNLDASAYADKRVVVKGCGDIYVPTSAYLRITTMLTGLAKSIMYGEPCSTVPVFKRKD